MAPAQFSSRFPGRSSLARSWTRSRYAVTPPLPTLPSRYAALALGFMGSNVAAPGQCLVGQHIVNQVMRLVSPVRILGFLADNRDRRIAHAHIEPRFLRQIWHARNVWIGIAIRVVAHQLPDSEQSRSQRFLLLLVRFWSRINQCQASITHHHAAHAL